MSMKNITSTIESTTKSETSSEVLFLKATLYGTWNCSYVLVKLTEILYFKFNNHNCCIKS